MSVKPELAFVFVVIDDNGDDDLRIAGVGSDLPNPRRRCDLVEVDGGSSSGFLRVSGHLSEDRGDVMGCRLTTEPDDPYIQLA